jgi:hypothetical protein
MARSIARSRSWIKNSTRGSSRADPVRSDLPYRVVARWAEGVSIARRWPLPTSESQTSAMKNDQLLNMAQSAFGRRAVNDGELDHHSGMPELIRPPAFSAAPTRSFGSLAQQGTNLVGSVIDFDLKHRISRLKFSTRCFSSVDTVKF